MARHEWVYVGDLIDAGEVVYHVVDKAGSKADLGDHASQAGREYDHALQARVESGYLETRDQEMERRLTELERLFALHIKHG